jgi:hypothetical protein
MNAEMLWLNYSFEICFCSATSGIANSKANNKLSTAFCQKPAISEYVVSGINQANAEKAIVLQPMAKFCRNVVSKTIKINPPQPIIVAPRTAWMSLMYETDSSPNPDIFETFE